MKLMRFSGRPVDKDGLQAYEVDFKAGFDAAMAKHALPGNEDKPLEAWPVDMLGVQADLKLLDEALGKKYKTVMDIKAPKTLKDWHELLRAFDCPIMVARSSEGSNEIVLVLVDQNF